MSVNTKSVRQERKLRRQLLLSGVIIRDVREYLDWQSEFPEERTSLRGWWQRVHPHDPLDERKRMLMLERRTLEALANASIVRRVKCPDGIGYVWE